MNRSNLFGSGKLGGQSIIDRGSKTVLPLLDEIVAARRENQILVMTGGGTRRRHAYTIALDLGMPIYRTGRHR